MVDIVTGILFSLCSSMITNITDNEKCLPRFDFPILGVTSLTLIAVGVGLAPMIQLLRYVFAFNKTVEEEDAELMMTTSVQELVLMIYTYALA